MKAFLSVLLSIRIYIFFTYVSLRVIYASIYPSLFLSIHHAFPPSLLLSLLFLSLHPPHPPSISSSLLPAFLPLFIYLFIYHPTVMSPVQNLTVLEEVSGGVKTNKKTMLGLKHPLI